MQSVTAYFSPRGNCAVAVVNAINAATTTLDVAIFSLTHDDITNALIAAHQRGVKMRAVMDADEAKGVYSDHTKLSDAGIDVRIDTMAGLMHDKIAIVDAGLSTAALATGSFNWTRSADRDNAENLLIITLPDIIAQYATQYEALWALNDPARVVAKKSKKQVSPVKP